jgi:uncharacterized protein
MVLGSNARVHVFRVLPHQDLKKAIAAFTATRKISACVMLTCVGSLEQYHLRFANEKSGSRAKGYFEIVSLTGTFSHSHGHLHISIADSNGKTLGGHLLDDNLVYTTAEVALAELPDLEFDRQMDPTYGYAELVVKPRQVK